MCTLDAACRAFSANERPSYHQLPQVSSASRCPLEGNRPIVRPCDFQDESSGEPIFFKLLQEAVPVDPAVTWRQVIIPVPMIVAGVNHP